MASISSDSNGTRRLLFVDKTKKRRTLYLGHVSMKTAEGVAARVESLITASKMGTEPEGLTAEWVAKIDDDLARKLAKWELIPERKKSEPKPVVTLNQFLKEWFDARSSAKVNTKVVWEQGRRNLFDYFGADRDISTIAGDEAVGFRDYLINDQDLGGESVKKRIRVVRMFLKEAVAKKLVVENPFASVPMPKAGMRKRQRQEYVPPDVVEAILPHCSRPLRLYVVFARYGGMRCPSETGSLKWADVDWQNLQLTITSPKTELHEGGESRQCPIFPKVLEELTAWRAEAPAEAVYVLDGLRTQRQEKPDWKNTKLGASLRCAIKAAGFEPWQKLFNSLRGSCETDLLAQGFQNHVVAAWLGHSVQVQERHYAKVRPEDFERAAEMTTRATQNPTHYLPIPVRTDSSTYLAATAKSEGLGRNARNASRSAMSTPFRSGMDGLFS